MIFFRIFSLIIFYSEHLKVMFKKWQYGHISWIQLCFNVMFHMINERTLVEVWCTLISNDFSLFQSIFASLRGHNWGLFRLKIFFLEALYWLTAPRKYPSIIFCSQDKRRVNTSFHTKSPWLFCDYRNGLLANGLLYLLSETIKNLI